MDAFEAIRERRSIRKFKSTPIPRDTVEKIVDAVRYAPSAVNIQPWEVVAVTDPATLRKIADATDYGRFIAEAPLCIVLFCRDTKYYLEDGCAAVQNTLIAATALGLGSCWVAGDKKGYAEKIGRLLSAPADHKLIALVPIGYPNEEKRPRRRRGLNEILHYERF